MSKKLTPDSQVPALKLPLVGGGTFDLSEESPENFTMVVFYRGLHCPVCHGFVGELAAMLDDFEAAGLSVVAASMDEEARARKSVEEWGLGRLRVAYGLTVEDAQNWGLYLSKALKEVESDIFSEPGLFWVRPDGKLYLANISNMPFARPDLNLLLSKVNYAVENNYPPRGTYAP